MLGLGALAPFAGCARVVSLPPRITLAEIEPSGHAAKPPDCHMPILRSDPPGAYRKVAIIEGLGNVFGNENDVLPLVASKACETGADAIIVMDSRSQTSENMTGYYVNAVAIVYGQNGGATAGP
jgi:hypothetical protein